MVRVEWAVAWNGAVRCARLEKLHSDGVLNVRQKNVIFSEWCIWRFCFYATDPQQHYNNIMNENL
jgi:hypothetical protein